MDRDSQVYLQDVVMAASTIDRFLEGKTFEVYQSDIVTKSAVERQFEIIGEALARLSKSNPDLA